MVKASKVSKFRRGMTIDPSHKGRWIYMWIFVSGFHRSKFRKTCNRNREITKRDIPKAKRICGGGASEWTVACHFEFHGGEVSKHMY
jgi:hypothetical protein